MDRHYRFEKVDDKYPFDKLSSYLSDVKQQFPQKTDATLLLEADIPYDILVAVMDHVRLTERPSTTNGLLMRAELFPEISIGDAPVMN